MKFGIAADKTIEQMTATSESLRDEIIAELQKKYGPGLRVIEDGAGDILPITPESGRYIYVLYTGSHIAAQYSVAVCAVEED